MPVCTDFVSTEFVQVQSSIEDCTAYVLVTSEEYETLFDSYELDAVTMGIAFSFGMGAVITAYLTAYPVGVIRRLLSDDNEL